MRGKVQDVKCDVARRTVKQSTDVLYVELKVLLNSCAGCWTLKTQLKNWLRRTPVDLLEFFCWRFQVSLQEPELNILPCNCFVNTAEFFNISSNIPPNRLECALINSSMAECQTGRQTDKWKEDGWQSRADTAGETCRNRLQSSRGEKQKEESVPVSPWIQRNTSWLQLSAAWPLTPTLSSCSPAYLKERKKWLYINDIHVRTWGTMR